MSQYGAEGIGDNIEFTAVNTGDYDIWLSKEGSDSEFTKYPDNASTARKFIIRADQNIDLVEINGVELSDPITIVQNKAHTEIRNVPVIFKMKLRTSTGNTALKLRWF